MGKGTRLAKLIKTIFIYLYTRLSYKILLTFPSSNRLNKQEKEINDGILYEGLQKPDIQACMGKEGIKVRRNSQHASTSSFSSTIQLLPRAHTLVGTSGY